MANTNTNETKINVTEQLENDIADVQHLAEQLLPFRNDIQSDENHAFSLPEPLINAQLQMLIGILHELHPADMAAVLENLPHKERELVWQLTIPEDDGSVLLEVSETVRESLIEHMDTEELVAAVENLDVDELAELADTLPESVVAEVMKDLNDEERAQVQAAMSYQDTQVGAVMDFEIVSVRADVSCEVVLRYLRRFDNLPNHTDKIFVVDDNDMLQGVLPIRKLLVVGETELVEHVMAKEVVKFSPLDDVADAAAAFERYDLVTAPVIDDQGKLIARLTVDEMVDVIREETEADMLNMAGLSDDEDLFAPVWDSVKNRWVWLAINLFTAFVASRVIGVFEESISQIVALAALMPIVAGIGGNSGNQTITMIVRALANTQISKSQATRLLKKELGVALVNGLIWGSIMGVVSWLMYGNLGIGLVMVAAMTLNLLLAAILGVLIPVGMERIGRDPALGSSVLITAVTDSGGFLIFLGLATLFLM